MNRVILRRAAVAMQRAFEARTIEFQVRYADEARTVFEDAKRFFEAHAQTVKGRPTEAARLIGTRALAFAVAEIEELERRLGDLEERVAEAVRSGADPRIRLLDNAG